MKRGDAEEDGKYFDTSEPGTRTDSILARKLGESKKLGGGVEDERIRGGWLVP